MSDVKDAQRTPDVEPVWDQGRTSRDETRPPGTSGLLRGIGGPDWLIYAAVAAVALAIGLGACLNAFLLFSILKKQKIYTPEPGWAMFSLKVAASVAFMAVVLYTTMGEARWWLGAPWQAKLPALAGLVALGAAAYTGALAAFGFRLRDFSRRSAA